jgi:uncharacterized membrane protein
MKPIFLCLIVFLLVTIKSFSQVLQRKQTTTPVVQRTITKTSVIPRKMQSSIPQNTSTKIDSAKATLYDASFVVVTAKNSSLDPETNKAANTHWSCTLFDQNNRQVASFNDDSNDEYVSGYQTPVLKMQVDNATLLGDFSKGGRLHISITPKGNDTWEISDFNLTIDFHNPLFTQKLTWNGIKLSQDKKDVDLFFNNNSGLKYDLKANKPA